ncbi:NPCBM/NEW2 domain-containing protein [Aquisphaera insulae]|uniref:NPCBM/NEW2 domain-containing protein n=1 Tax=Aquisphaera insulae TaxID=2712864 RepID=UPI0013ED6679|nr:NPCBM/NEW2 domain-containing protein [Aquisphaera insulae]
MNPLRGAAMIVVIALISCRLSGPAAAAADDPSAPSLVGVGVDGKKLAGRLTGLTPKGIELSSGEGAGREIPYREVVKLTRDPLPPPQSTDGSHVLLPGGDRIMRVVVGATTETSLDVQSRSSLGKMSIPLDTILGLILASPAEPDPFDRLWYLVREEPRSSEVVWLANGDRLSGGFLGMDDRSIRIQVDGKAVEVDRTGVIGVGFDPAVVGYPRPASDYLEISIADGSRLGVIGARLEKGHILGSTRFGQAIRIPASELVQIVPRTDRVAYLSEIKPDKESYVSYVGQTRPYRADRTAEGRRFQLQGKTYERGIGTQSRTLLAFKLRPEDRRFQALVGVDDSAGPLGNIVFKVYADGQVRFTSQPMAARDDPCIIDVDVSGAKVLILATEFGDRGDVRDIADWVEARIIR